MKKSDRNFWTVMLILGIAFLLFLAYAGYGLYWEGVPSIKVFPVNESETADGIIVHLTEEDFERWPSLGKAFKENDDSVQAPELRTSPGYGDFIQEYMYDSTTERYIFVEYEGSYFRIMLKIP